LQDSITKEIIALDKKLREKIELLELEKQHLDQTIDKETNKLIEQFKIELSKLIDETNKKNETFFKVKEQSVKNDFEARLKSIQNQYNQHKDAWIECIFNACIDLGDHES
jgi:V/A-type H+/Na+-transporting ATPase subunit G/H